MATKKFKILIVLMGISISLKSIDYSEESFDSNVEKSEETTKQKNKRQKTYDLSEVVLEEESKTDFEKDFIYGGNVSELIMNNVVLDENYKDGVDLVASLSNSSEKPEVIIKPESVKKKYACTVSGCNIRFSSNKSLKKHVRFKHRGIGYTCVILTCNREFHTQGELQNHMKRHLKKD